MKCKECGSTSNEYNDSRGETSCKGCGLILMHNALEETVNLGHLWNTESGVTDGWTGHVNRSFDLGSQINIKDLNSKKARRLYRIQLFNQKNSASDRNLYRLSNMFLSYYNVSAPLRNRVKTYYKILQKKNSMRGISIEIRAASLTYYILKEVGIATTIKRHEKITKVNKKDISKQAKKIATVLGKPWIFSQINLDGLVEHIGYQLSCKDTKFLGKVKKLAEQIQTILLQRGEIFTSAYLAATFYLVNIFERKHYTQIELAKAIGTTEVSLRTNVKKILNMYGVESNRILYYTLDDFMLGVKIR